jgi:hypothetical protein
VETKKTIMCFIYRLLGSFCQALNSEIGLFDSRIGRQA